MARMKVTARREQAAGVLEIAQSSEAAILMHQSIKAN